MDTRSSCFLSSPDVHTRVAFGKTGRTAWGRGVYSRGVLALLLAFVAVSGRGSELGAVEDGLVRVVVAKADGVGVGTGFLVDRRGHIATNHHVVADAAGIAVHFSGSSAIIEAAALWSSSDLDLAVIAIKPSNRAPVRLAEHIPDKGASVYALGFPGDADIPTTHGVALDATVTRGVLGRVFEGTWDTRELTVLQHDADISAGSSGGPLLDECGRVIGVNTSGAAVTVKSADGSAQVLQTASGIYWASSVGELTTELRRLGIAYQAESSPCSDASKILSPVVAPTIDRSSDSSDGFGSINAVWLAAAVVGLSLALFALSRNNRKLAEILARIDQHRPFRTVGHQPPGPPGVQLVLRSADRTDAGTPFVVDDVAAANDTGVVVGRHPMVADRVLHEADVSRRHMRIRFVRDTFQIEDLNSGNGTSLNGTPLNPYRPVRVGTGDRLRCGTTEFDVSIARATESSP